MLFRSHGGAHQQGLIENGGLEIHQVGVQAWDMEPRHSKPNSSSHHHPKSGLGMAAFNRLLMGCLLLCLMLVLYLASQLQAQAGQMIDCGRQTGVVKHELENAKKKLYTTRSQIRELNEQRGELQKELDSAASRLEHINSVKHVLKKELEGIIKKYVELKREKREISAQYELTSSQAQQLGMQSHQLDTLLGFLHNGMKTLETSTGEATTTTAATATVLSGTAPEK